MVYDIILGIVGVSAVLGAALVYKCGYYVDSNGTVRDIFPFWKLMVFSYAISVVTMIGILL